MTETREPANPYTLPDDLGLEVYQNQSGTISIKQEDSYNSEPAIVLVSPERVNRLIEFLKAVKDEILTQRADAAAEENTSASPRLSL